MSKTYHYSDLQVDDDDVSLGENVTFSFSIRNYLPYAEYFPIAPSVQPRDGNGFVFLLIEEVNGNKAKLVSRTFKPTSIGDYIIAVGDMRVEFTVS